VLPELRPRGIGEILDTAVALYRARIGRLLGLTALVVVPVQALSALVLMSGRPDTFDTDTNLGVGLPVYSTRQDFATLLAARLVVLTLTVVSTAFVTAACTRAVADAYVGQEDQRREFVRVAGRRIFAVVGLSIIVAIAQALGFFACFVGFFAVLGFFAVAIPALILERVGVFAAIGRSFTLTKLHFWRSLGIAFSAQVLGATMTFGLTAALIGFLFHGAGPTAAIISQSIANALSSTITTPFIAAAAVVLYFDLRIRDEGFDIQLMLQQLDVKDAPPPPPPPPQPAYVQ
jgi:hypothetical protein